MTNAPAFTEKSKKQRDNIQNVTKNLHNDCSWLVDLMINVDLAIFQPYLDLEAGDNQSLKIQVARPGIEPRSSCSASQELNHSATAAPTQLLRTDLDRSVGVTAVTQLVWLNRFTSAQPSHQPQQPCNQKDIHLKICKYSSL